VCSGDCAAQRSALEPQADRREACRLKAPVGPPTPFSQKRPRLPSPLPHQPPAGLPARHRMEDPSAFNRWMPAGTPAWSPPLPARLRTSRRLGHPTSADVPTARRPRRLLHRPLLYRPPSAVGAFLRRERCASRRPATPSARPSRNAHWSTSHRLPFPPQAGEPRSLPERAPCSLLTDSRTDRPRTTGRSATPTRNLSAQTSPSLSPDSGPGMTNPSPPASGRACNRSPPRQQGMPK